MKGKWKSTALADEADVFAVLTKLRGKRWLCRGQAKPYGTLIPSIDRGNRVDLSRTAKLGLERESIDLFRATARFFAHQGEEAALSNDVMTLMVLRHYGVPTRLLDWSHSPQVAAYFSVCDHDKEDGEIWAFDHDAYAANGQKQWEKWPETTRDRNPAKFDANLTAFTVKEPPDWFVCTFYPQGFPRQHAQQGCYSMTARFGRDHAKAIATLLADSALFHRYTVAAPLKRNLRRALREKHGLWRGSLFPDTAGAADTARHAIFSD